jgi:2,4-dienoyl-CoA reductase-like NADH-dependent reductase (Old Yellow Enzyme family)
MNTPSDPFKFQRTGKITRNRTVLAAMTNKQSHEDGTLSDAEINWLVHRAKGGFGIITTAATHVSKDGQSWDGEFGVFDDLHLEQLNKLTNLIRKEGSLSLAQLFHGGCQSSERLTGSVPLSSSKNISKGSNSGYSREANEEDIYRIIDDFADAANRCVAAGFDGVELHGAHGYLISQFLGEKTNTRKDNWGGDFKRRSRFLLEIFRSIKNIVPESFIVGVRISPEIESMGINLDDSINLFSTLTNEGIDFIHLSCWNAFKGSVSYRDDSKTLTEWFVTSLNNLPPIISTGKVWSHKDAQNLLNQGADLIGIGRAAIGYPDWARQVKNIYYDPAKPPFSVDQLREAMLSDVFIEYMRNWEGFVSDQ